MGSPLLMGHQNMMDPVRALVDGIIDVQHRSARISEDVGDALINQRFNQDFCTFQFHSNYLQNFRE